MHYEAPTFVEIKMDAEISAYQDEFDQNGDMPHFATAARATEQDDTQA